MRRSLSRHPAAIPCLLALLISSTGCTWSNPLAPRVVTKVQQVEIRPDPALLDRCRPRPLPPPPDRTEDDVIDYIGGLVLAHESCRAVVEQLKAPAGK